MIPISFKNKLNPSLKPNGAKALPSNPGVPSKTKIESAIKSWVIISCSTTNADFFNSSMDFLNS